VGYDTIVARLAKGSLRARVLSKEP
jgi:hypothetical protein